MMASVDRVSQNSLHRLYAKRAELQLKREPLEARGYFGDEGIGTDQQAGARINEISTAPRRRSARAPATWH
ncbi:hypothetical protein ATY81_01500 [Rhizobium sp. R72]|nr:hypothetical protein ATY81_01500 [Rhizobium sp. R72]OWW05742.1 hypothetical protein ATY80_01500 [Rhizobium sp. R711]